MAADTVTAEHQALPDAAYIDALLADSAPSATLSVVSGDSAADGVITLPTQCLLRDAIEYRQHLLDRLHHEVAAIDVGAVDRIDAAFMQMLLSFVRSRADDNARVEWLNVNATFAEAAALLGLQAALALPDVSVAA